MNPISRLVAVSAFAVLVVAWSPVALSQAAQGSSGDSQFEAFLKAANEGNAQAQLLVGLSYKGGRGTSKDLTEAARWYRRAAVQGNSAAQYFLGVMYAEGEGVPKNNAEAVKWYRLAADQGYANAQHDLGLVYANGAGVPKNDAEAYFWWNLSAAQGNEYAKTNRDIVEKRMTREQIAEAQRRSAAWKPKKE
jgi:TPR repeat protein